MTQDAAPQEPDAEPDPTAGHGDHDPPDSPDAAEQPPRQPLWTHFLIPTSVLIGAAIIVGAIFMAADDPAATEPVGPTLAALSEAIESLSDDVESLAADVEQLSSGAPATPVAPSTPTTPTAPSAPSTLREALGVYAASLDLDADRFGACLEDAATYEVIGEQLQRGIDLGVTGTPTFFVNNKLISGAQPAALFAAVIAAELEGSPTSLDEYPAAIRQLAERERPGFAILPERPDVSGAPIEGNPDARVVIAEFSDFECPFCQRWYDETLPDIRALIGDDVALAFLHFPLTGIHPNAATAHAAAECAGSEGKFWEMHDLLFERQAEWSRLPNVN